MASVLSLNSRGKQSEPLLSKTLAVEFKTFVLQQSFIGKVTSIVFKEWRKGFHSSCELDTTGALWFLELLKAEIRSDRKCKDVWRTKSKLRKIWVIRDHNDQGEFLRLATSNGDNLKKPQIIIIPKGEAASGWKNFTEVLSSLLVKETKKAVTLSDNPQSDLRWFLDQKKFGCWRFALVVSTSMLTVSWHQVGLGISKRFGLKKNFDLHPFSLTKAVFFTTSEEKAQLFCEKGEWEEAGVKLEITKWTPLVNAITEKEDVKWILIHGLPFHCWDENTIRSIFTTPASVLEIAPQTLNLSDLSAARVKIKNLSLSLPCVITFRGKDVETRIRMEEIPTSPEMGEMWESEYHQIGVEVEETYVEQSHPLTASGLQDQQRCTSESKKAVEESSNEYPQDTWEKVVRSNRQRSNSQQCSDFFQIKGVRDFACKSRYASLEPQDFEQVDTEVGTEVVIKKSHQAHKTQKMKKPISRKWVPTNTLAADPFTDPNSLSGSSSTSGNRVPGDLLSHHSNPNSETVITRRLEAAAEKSFSLSPV